MADVVDTNSFKNGMHIELDGKVWRILEFQHVKPGKGGAFVRTELRSLDAGAVVDRTFRAGEKFPRVHTETKNVQYLYEDGTEAHFMDEQTYDQFTLPRGEVATELQYMQPSSSTNLPARPWPRPSRRTSSRTACTSSSTAASGASSSSST